ncbi:hypothetical protein F5050DRAFT_1809516 [Lentinula boryana]|uniref:Uncharacterized protein n=1 Tax=Lentinula boryana TaxID=40481 RepID=A0ABQ8Q7H3_9AGAR|nr:hypothetical protein F5050DRAFT_1809516 [Lentinula boryana]
MNSYPIELIAHLSPVMFVAGLDEPPGPPPGQPQPPMMGTGTGTGTTSSGTTTSSGMGKGMGTIPIQPPAPTHHSRNSSLTTLPTLPTLSTLPSMPSSSMLPSPNNLRPSPPPVHPGSSSTRPPSSDEFTVLRSRLRDILVGQRKIAVWDAPGTTSDGGGGGGERDKEKEKTFHRSRFPILFHSGIISDSTSQMSDHSFVSMLVYGASGMLWSQPLSYYG